jgi:uncharacterized protein (TIGR00730 family)
MLQYQKTMSENKEKFFVGPMTKDEVQEAIRARVSEVDRELRGIFQFIKDYPKSVTFFGSARVDETNLYYNQARHLSARIAKELGYTVLTGGGGGIMEAANRGAHEAGGQSVGLNIKLPKEQQLNQYTSASYEAYYFFVRKVGLSFAAEAYLFFPGGFGTLDELFEILTLVQTNKIRKTPVILVGTEYWHKLNEFIAEMMLKKVHAIDQEDMNLYTITDDEDEIIRLIKETPVTNSIPVKKFAKN